MINNMSVNVGWSQVHRYKLAAKIMSLLILEIPIQVDRDINMNKQGIYAY